MKAEDQSAEREAFDAQFPHLDRAMTTDGWGRLKYVHEHVESIWHGWQVRAALSAREAPATEQRLWLWRNFVDGRPEYWAFDNPYPCVTVGGDPLTLGQPCGYAIFKASVNGRPNLSEAEVIATVTRMHAADPAPPAAKAVEMDATRAAMALALEAMQDALEDAQLAQSEYDGRTYSFCTSCGADDLQTPTVGKHTPHCAWGKVLAAISELELQIAALSKQGGNHG